MMTPRMFTAVALVGASAWAHAAGRPVEVCVAMGEDFAVQRAESIAGGMFVQAGVVIEWHRDRACPSDAIRISFSDGTNRKFRPEALAYALPYEKTHIEVFYDRLQQHGSGRLPILLAHVLVHEITHILQGVCRHSKSGVMMARWGTDEYNEMAFKPLPFTQVDVQLIQIGLDARESLMAAAKY
jgi:hypothetical protein